MNNIKKMLNKLVFSLLIVLCTLFVYKKIRTPEKVAIPISKNNEKGCYNERGEEKIEKKKDVEVKILSETDVENIVKNYISNHPEEIIKSIKNLKQKKADDFLDSDLENIRTKNNPPIIGNKDGTIKIVFFYDYACYYCKIAYDSLKKLIKENDNVQVILRPISILSEDSLYAAYIGLSINKFAQSNFFLFHEQLFAEKNLTKKSIDQILDNDKISLSNTQKEMNDEQIKKLLNDNFDLAANLKIQGLPFYIIGKEIFSSALSVEELKDIIQ